jgi:O-acetyl-ADP-ribose deacetylase (regulator of RNase III)
MIEIVGDATRPIAPGNKIIVHVCNDVGAWGAGFVLALSSRWKEPEESYRSWFKEQANQDEWPKLQLGETIFVPVEPEITVANMVAQHGIGLISGSPPIRYDALEECLRDVARWARDWDHASVHMPRIGCGLAGGTWREIKQIVLRSLEGVETYVYDLPKNQP